MSDSGKSVKRRMTPGKWQNLALILLIGWSFILYWALRAGSVILAVISFSVIALAMLMTILYGK